MLPPPLRLLPGCLLVAGRRWCTFLGGEAPQSAILIPTPPQTRRVSSWAMRQSRKTTILAATVPGCNCSSSRTRSSRSRSSCSSSNISVPNDACKAVAVVAAVADVAANDGYNFFSIRRRGCGIHIAAATCCSSQHQQKKGGRSPTSTSSSSTAIVQISSCYRMQNMCNCLI
ncbi:GM14238 [Drosophila sechellia]|uniref:GM14238 n=1 Tax=Drosophila sechellia TaxID=7238 RepID=B4HVM9_DROSE|nr:GM14238 [Drosophila sechellia]